MGAKLDPKQADGQLAYLEGMRERHGDVFALRLFGGQELLVVGAPEPARQVFQASPEVLGAGEANRRALGWLLGEGSLILLEGERHMSHRRLLLPPLHGKRVERQAEEMRALVERRLDELPTGRERALLPPLRRLTAEVALRFAVGLPAGERSEALRDAFLALQDAGPAGEGARETLEAVRAGVGAEVARRRAERREGDGDVLSILLDADTTDGEHLSDVEVREELLTLVVAGAETTAASLAWALERLARAPEALARATEEAQEGEGSYLEAVIRETLRMRPAVPLSARVARRPFRIGERTAEPGTQIAVSALLIHHRPDLYREPLAFRPERFLDARPAPYAWIPFGGGVRRCIGAAFAEQEMRIVLAALLARLAPRAPDPEPEGMRSRGNTLVPAAGARLALEPRPRPKRPAGGARR